MATKRVTKVTYHDDEDDEKERLKIQARQDLENDPAEQSFAEFVNRQKGQGCRVKVYRQTPNGRQYCFHDTPEKVNDEAVRLYHAKQRWASEEGEYDAWIEVNGELRGPYTFNIAPQVGTPGAESAPNGGMADVIRLLQQQNERLEQRLMQAERTPMTEIVDSMAKLDQLRGGPQSQQMPIEAIMKAVEIGQRLGPQAAEDWSSLLMSAVKDNAPLLLGLLRGMFQPKPGPPSVQPSAQAVTPPPPVQAVPVQVIPPNEDEPMNDSELREMLSGTIQFLKGRAIKGSDPEIYLRMIEDGRGEDEVYDRLISEVLNSDFSAFAELDPDIEKPPFRDFFRFLYDGIKRIFGPKNSMEAVSVGQLGNTADASTNGSGSKRRSK